MPFALKLSGKGKIYRLSRELDLEFQCSRTSIKDKLKEKYMT